MAQVRAEMAAATLTASVAPVAGTRTNVGIAGIAAGGVNAPNVSFANQSTGSAGLGVAQGGTPAVAGAHVPTVLGTNPAVGTIEYLVEKLPAKSEDDRVIEIQRSFIRSGTTRDDYVKRVTGRPTVLTFLTIKPKTAEI